MVFPTSIILLSEYFAEIIICCRILFLSGFIIYELYLPFNILFVKDSDWVIFSSLPTI